MEMELPPYFAGKNPKDWLRKYNHFCSSLRIPDSEKKDWVEPFLIDRVKIWYEIFKKLMSAPFSWDEFSDNLIWSFGGRNEEASNSHHSKTMDQMDEGHKVDVPDTPDRGNIVTYANDTHHKSGDVKIAPASSNTRHIVITDQKRLVRNGCRSPLNISSANKFVGKEKAESDVHLDLTFPTASTSPLNDIGGRERIGNDRESLTSKGKRVMRTGLAFKAPDAQSAHLLHNPELGQFIGHPTVDELTKRRKQRFTTSSNGECSTEAFDSPDIVLNCSSRNAQRTYETRSWIDETSPSPEVDGPSTHGINSVNTAGAMTLQIEDDEILAMELQEQFHNEEPSVGVGETHTDLEMSLQQVHELSPQISRRRNGSNSRRSSIASSSRQPQLTAAAIVSRRGYQPRAPTVNRMTRSRNRGLPRPLLSIRQIDSLFSADMDVDLRMHILEAIVAIDDMGVDNSLPQSQRDFNEDDYEEILSALEENIHQDRSSVSEIDSLPQSIVQIDNFEEACAICFDTPAIGDTIRHLPCLSQVS